MQYLRLGLTSTLLSLIFVGSSVGQDKTSPESRLRSLTVTVTNSRGDLVGGLARENFLISQGKGRCTVRTAEITHEPLNVAFVIDTSGSMQIPEFREIARPGPIARTLASFVELANTQNQYLLVSFGPKPEVRADWTRDVKTLVSSIPSKTKGHTALYDALILAVNTVAKGPHRKSAIILFSDGSDNTSSQGFAKVRDLLKVSEVQFYASGIREVFQAPGQPDGRDVLLELTELTGGLTYFPKNSQELDRMASLLATELHNQYRLAFECPGITPNHLGQITVEVKAPMAAPERLKKLKVRARKWVLAAC